MLEGIRKSYRSTTRTVANFSRAVLHNGRRFCIWADLPTKPRSLAWRITKATATTIGLHYLSTTTGGTAIIGTSIASIEIAHRSRVMPKVIKHIRQPIYDGAAIWILKDLPDRSLKMTIAVAKAAWEVFGVVIQIISSTAAYMIGNNLILKQESHSAHERRRADNEN